MLNINSKLNLFVMILIMSAFAVLGGLAGTYLFSNGRMLQDLYIGDVPVKGLTKQEAINKVSERYNHSHINGSINIKYKNNVNFSINYEEIDAIINYEKTVDKAYANFPGKMGENLLSSIGGSKKISAPIVFSINEFKLKYKLKELAKDIDIQPSNSNIFVENGKVIKTEGTIGRRLNIENSAKKIIDSMGQYVDTAIIFEDSNNFEIDTVYPQITITDFDGVDTIISEHTTLLESPESEASAKLAASSIDKAIILAKDSKKGLEEEVFSFNQYLWKANGSAQKEDEGYNQVASTLYAAVLKTAIDPVSIKRVPHKTYTNYIEPGFDVCVGISAKDFTFSNSLDYNIVVLSEISQGKVIVTIIGNNTDLDTEITISSETVQKYLPTIITLENRDLKQGESIIISNGRPGLKVRTYKNTKKLGIEKSEILISTDIYDSIDSIIQVGPDTKLQGYK